MSPFDICIASSSVVFMIHAASRHETYIHIQILCECWHTQCQHQACIYITTIHSLKPLYCVYKNSNHHHLAKICSMSTNNKRLWKHSRYNNNLRKWMVNKVAWMSASCNASIINIVSLYTVSHKKRATLFLIISPAFLGRFLYCLYQ